jgi:hypothetical protein
LIIGVAGFAGSGKGTVSDLLVDEYGFNKLAFADPLKDAVAAIFGWPRHLLEGDTKESREFRETPDKFWSERFGFEVTPRWALQKQGTEAGRDVFHESIWVSALERRINSDKVVVTDVRFPNEVAKIKELGGHVIRVVRGPEPEWYDVAYEDNLGNRNRRAKMMDMFPDVHYSEWAWIGTPFNYVLDNNGTLQELRASVVHMLQIFTGPVDVPVLKGWEERPDGQMIWHGHGISPMVGPTGLLHALRPLKEAV